ncbi:MAG TPA: hypothetical protein VHD62_06245 [Opitutaceae bacterium]|nr:hypothetical protein [Opitutaceae bacterium]
MKFIFPSFPRSSRRSTLLDLHRFGLMQVFRRPSLLRLWAPLRETNRAEIFET